MSSSSSDAVCFEGPIAWRDDRIIDLCLADRFGCNRILTPLPLFRCGRQDPQEGIWNERAAAILAQTLREGVRRKQMRDPYCRRTGHGIEILKGSLEQNTQLQKGC
jgi:hypothetical protein